MARRPVSAVRLRDRRVLVAIIGIAFLLRVAAVVTLRAWESPVTWENGAIARSIVAGHGFSFDYGEGAVSHYYTSDHPVPTSFQAPFYPYMLAGFYVLGRHVGADAALVLLLILQSAVGAALVIPVFRIGHRLFGKDAALLAAAIAAVYPTFVYTATVLHQAVWCVTGFSVGFLALLRLRYRPAFGSAATLGVILGVLLLIEPVFLGLLAAAFAGLVVVSHARRQVAAAGAISLAIAMLLASPWLVRCYAVHGRFVFVKSSSGFNLWQGNNPASDRSVWQGGFRHRPFPGLSDLRSRLKDTDDELERDDIWREAAVATMRADPVGTAVRFARKAAFFWTITADHQLARSPWYWLPYAVLFLLAIGALVAMRSWPREYMPVLLALAAATLVYSVAFTGPRYRMPLEPMLFLFSAEGALLPRRFAMARARRKIVHAP